MSGPLNITFKHQHAKILPSPFFFNTEPMRIILSWLGKQFHHAWDNMLQARLTSYDFDHFVSIHSLESELVCTHRSSIYYDKETQPKAAELKNRRHIMSAFCFSYFLPGSTEYVHRTCACAEASSVCIQQTEYTRSRKWVCYEKRWSLGFQTILSSLLQVWVQPSWRWEECGEDCETVELRHGLIRRLATW